MMREVHIHVHNHPRATRDAGEVRIVQNKMLGGWFVVRGSSDTPISGRFSSKEEAQAWLNRNKAKDARMYPGYTTVQLKEFVKKESDPETKKKMEAEIAARESGASTVRVTPQILGGKPVNKIGRM